MAITIQALRLRHALRDADVTTAATKSGMPRVKTYGRGRTGFEQAYSVVILTGAQLATLRDDDRVAFASVGDRMPEYDDTRVCIVESA